MRFSIQEDGQNKKFFHTLAAAQKETGLNIPTIKSVLERNNSCHHRRSDNKIFFIQKEPPVKILSTEGEDFFSLEEIQEKFGLTPTKFVNQLKNRKFPQKIDWISPEIFSPESSSSEKSEIESLREELDEMKKELDSLSARVWKLEKENKELKEEKQSKEEKDLKEIAKSSPEKIKETSLASLAPLPSVASSGEKLPFDTSKKISKNDLVSAKTIADFIKFGITGQMVVNGPKKK